jgi:multidrug efflux pump subunit AcrA (membrane-fusion protein)
MNTLYFSCTLIVISALHTFGERTGASFKEGAGVLLSEESRQAIKLEIADVEDRTIALDVKITAHVYRESGEASHNSEEISGYAYASALVTPKVAEQMGVGTKVQVTGPATATGSVIRQEKNLVESGGLVEVIIQIEDTVQNWKIGSFALVSPAQLREREAMVIPGSAVLESAFGDFVFVVNGNAYLRTPVTIGQRNVESVEILDGLFSGDQVVTHPVETMYLIELRATKGGGHCH